MGTRERQKLHYNRGEERKGGGGGGEGVKTTEYISVHPTAPSFFYDPLTRFLLGPSGQKKKKGGTLLFLPDFWLASPSLNLSWREEWRNAKGFPVFGMDASFK